MATRRSVPVWVVGLLLVTVFAGAAVGLESDGDEVSVTQDASLSCEQTGVFVSDWDYQRSDGRIDALTIDDVDESCMGAEIAASVADADGIPLASTDSHELTGQTQVTLPFSDVRPRVADVEQLEIFIVGAGEPPEPPDEPPTRRVDWDGEGPGEVECSGEVAWVFELSGDLRGVKAEITAVFGTAGQAGPVPAERSGPGPATELVATVVTDSGDVLEEAWASLSKDAHASMVLTLRAADCSDD